MRSGLRHTLVALAALGAFGCREAAPPPPVHLSVLASSSLEEVVLEAAKDFEAAAHVAVEVRTGETRKLAAELSSGSSADLFLAAGPEWMDRLEKEGRIVPGSRWEAVGNRLVILGRSEARYPSVRIVNMATLEFRRLVVPDPSRNPAGRDARRWLSRVGLRGQSVWRQLEDRIEKVDSVGEVLRAVAEDPSAAGVVFATDVGRVPQDRALFRSPDLGFRYSFALVSRPGRPPEAQGFLDFLRSPAGVDLLRGKGFLLETGTVGSPGSP